ncbi:MAG: hypothetical protein ABI602_03480 [Candidatus Saccharibacteria bacterium]
MNKQSSTRRLVENEMLTRTNNIKAGQALAAMSTIISSVYFNCECSQATCLEKVRLTVATYTKLHLLGNRFVIKPGHETSAIESVEVRAPKYWVVQKFSLSAHPDK